MIESMIKERVNKLPKGPGVYIFTDKSRKILYIGKATSLKDRVRQYFSGTDVRGERIFSMVSKIENIKVIETDSVLEALILESNLIKKHQPKYNIKERDDKSFSFFSITNEEFPRVLIFRETDLKKNDKLIKNIFGPYTSKKQMEVSLGIIRKIFPFHSLKQKTEKGCLDFQIGRCPGPYAGEISRRDYLKNIRGIKMILDGKMKNLLKKLEVEMKKLAEAHEFEKAKELRDKIFALKHINDVALISSGESKARNSFRIEAYDISNISGEHAVGSMVVFENGEENKSQYRKFKIKAVEGSNDVGMMAEVLFRRLRNKWKKPKLILLDGGIGHLNMAKKILKEFKLEIPLIAVAKGPTRKKLDLRFSNKNYENTLDDNLIKQIMDEAHRFAISYHRKIRKRDFI